MSQYNYKVIRVSDLDSVSEVVHFDPNHTIPELAAIATALTLGLLSPSVEDDVSFFQSLDGYGFAQSGLKFQNGVVAIHRTLKEEK